MGGPWIWTVHLAVTWFLVGLIWTIHTLHYPLFAAATRDFHDYHQRHMRRITFLVGPLMLAELAGAVWLWLSPPPNTDPARWLAALILLGVVWAETAIFAIPHHRRLETEGCDRATHRALMAGNLVRTLAWTARGIVVAWP